MTGRNPYAQKAYKSNNILSLSPGEQVARLLETAGKHILRARDCIDAQDYEARFQATEDAMKIITGLQGCLEQQPEAADVYDTLNGYYSSLTLMITRINVGNDRDKCDEVVDSLKTMAATWREIDKKTAATKQDQPSMAGQTH